MKYVWLSILSLCVLLSGCSNLTDIRAGVCGNGIVDPGEDCDGPAASCGSLASDHPCRFLCKKASDCPQSYECGNDGVCREPTGTFTAGSSVPSVQALSYSVADMDGDGYQDLVAANKAAWVGVDYLGPGGLVGTTRSRSAQLPFAVGQLTEGDTRADIAHLPGAELDVLTGESDRTLLPQAYSGIQTAAAAGQTAVLFSLDAISVKPSDGDDFTRFGGQELLVLTGPTLHAAVANQQLVPVHESSDKLAPRLKQGAIPTANLDARPDSPCDEFVLADKGAGFVSVYSPCAGPGLVWNTDPDKYNEVSLPLGVGVTEGVLLARINADDYPDLLIAANHGPTDTAEDLYVAYGVADAQGHGTGAFNSTPLQPGATPYDSMATLLIKNAPGLPLAAGGININNDSIDDFVFHDRVAVSGGVGASPDDLGVQCGSGAPCWTTILNGNWSEAKIADLNKNDLPDIVAVPDGARYVEFYNGTGSVLFNRSEIQTNGYPQALTIGDFDGDLVPDVAVAESNDSGACGTERNDSVSILFGALAEPPAEPVSMGKLDCVSQLVSGNFFFAGNVDWTTDLAALDTIGDGSKHVALFAGSTDRQLAAPLSLTAPNSHEIDRDIGVQIGKFDESQANADIALLSLTGDSQPRHLQLWTLPATANAELSTSYASGSLGTELDPCSTRLFRADLDGDGLDELVLLGRSKNLDSRVVVARVDKKSHKAAIQKALTVTDIDLVQPSVSRFACSKVNDAMHAQPPDNSESTQVEITDLDGDGKQEVVALGLSGKHHVLRVFAWPGSGPITESKLRVPEGIDPLGFAIMNADGDAAQEIVLATQGYVYVSDFDPDAGTIGTPQPVGNLDILVDKTTVPGVGIAGVLGVAPGDFNGDGVPDFAVAKQSGFDMFYGVPGLP